MLAINLIVITLILICAELLYFRIASRYNILDKPNYRSSHIASTVRGGGILFTFSSLLFFASNRFEFPLFISGLLLITLVSFLDDIYTLNSKLRLGVQIISVLLLISELNLYCLPIILLIVILIVIVGIINAFNFMDGINGITGCYNLCIIVSLFYLNQYLFNFVNSQLLVFLILSVLVFNFFNFRRKALCFAGDVGSVSIAFIIVFLIGKLIIETNDFSYILFLIVYGLDAGTTILFRVIRQENIMEPHRSHFYQYLANERSIPHLYVSAGYGAAQLCVNALVIIYAPLSFTDIVIIILVVFSLFGLVRLWIEGLDKLLYRR